jgi:hypothetical protein
MMRGLLLWFASKQIFKMGGERYWINNLSNVINSVEPSGFICKEV